MIKKNGCFAYLEVLVLSDITLLKQFNSICSHACQTQSWLLPNTIVLKNCSLRWAGVYIYNPACRKLKVLCTKGSPMVKTQTEWMYILWQKGIENWSLEWFLKINLLSNLTVIESHVLSVEVLLDPQGFIVF